MLKKSSRLSTEQVSCVMEKGKSVHSTFFTVRFLNKQKSAGFAAIVSKKVAKTAVSRNFIRRKIYEALHVGAMTKKNKDNWIAILAKKDVATFNLKDLTKDLQTLFQKVYMI